jgi:predicted GIY-YIG superfamily endonuclease
MPEFDVNELLSRVSNECGFTTGLAVSQLLLIPDPRPLDERLGEEFFRKAPKRTGVYLMRDAGGNVLYVGKAKTLQQRLRCYRIANPDRMPRRHLKLVRQVAKIDFQFCPNEAAALKRESKLLRSLKPKYNRAGVWPGKVQFLTWRGNGEWLELKVLEVPEAGWQRFGPLGSGKATCLHQALSRLVWLAVNPDRATSEFPVGWLQGGVRRTIAINCRGCENRIMGGLDGFFWAEPHELLEWLAERLATRTHPFEQGIIEPELEYLQEFFTKPRNHETFQLWLL